MKVALLIPYPCSFRIGIWVFKLTDYRHERADLAGVTIVVKEIIGAIDSDNQISDPKYNRYHNPFHLSLPIVFVTDQSVIEKYIDHIKPSAVLIGKNICKHGHFWKSQFGLIECVSIRDRNPSNIERDILSNPFNQ
jgi:hypothetical protein